MSWTQKIINAQVSVNRLVWGVNNYKLGMGFQTGKKRAVYFRTELKAAISDLQEALTEFENQNKEK